MKISKSLLQAILVGAVVSTASTSCEKIEDANDTILEKANEVKVLEAVTPDPKPIPDNCPACGMG
jgi:hypothetical protein